MFTAAERRTTCGWQRSCGARIRVYCPNESEPINDKTRTDITTRMIYDVDIAAVESCNVLICQVSEDSGTNWEAGYLDCLPGTSIPRATAA